MLRSVLINCAVLLLPAASLLSGCGKSSTPNASPPATEQVSQTDPTSHGHANSTDDSQDTEIAAALAKLTAEDRALAVKQRICPVSGELLGSMGAPIKIDVKGQPVLICCDGCKADLLAKPDEYLAKLNK
jgi:hypothetical protein